MLNQHNQYQKNHLKIGVLALQGAFREHAQMLESLHVETSLIRLPEQLTEVSGLIIPGGESTTMLKLMNAYGFMTAVTEFHNEGGVVWGTCAGAIVIASNVVKTTSQPSQASLGLLDIAVARNAYGRQVASFEVDVELVEEFSNKSEQAKPFSAVFIRAPRIEDVGEDVTVLASYENHPIMVKGNRAMATVFHPELTQDTRIHEFFLDNFFLN